MAAVPRPLRVSTAALSLASVLPLLKNPPEDVVCTLPPLNPRAGEVYVYRGVSNEDGRPAICVYLVDTVYNYINYYYLEDWRCDQIKWVNQGVQKLPRTLPTVKKTYFHVATESGSSNSFVKHCYQRLSPDNIVVIHYLGDDTCVGDQPHGNSKREEARPHIRTCPSVLRDLSEECKYSKAANAYRRQIASVRYPTHVAVKQPRNVTQVRNVRSQVLNKQRLSHDSLYNLHEIAINLSDYVHIIRTHPDLICVCGQKGLLDEMDRMLIVNSPLPQLLSYDTTFKLGDFYLSTLAFRHTAFVEAPVIPSCFLLHERKFKACHEEMFKICSRLVPSLSKTTFPIVTDEEQAFISSMSAYFSSPHLRCWNHIFRCAMRWLQSHGAPSQDVALYTEDIRHLLHLPSEKDYNSELEQLSYKWSAPFYDYYMHNIHSDIHCIARWAVEPLGVYNPFSGVTNNQAEGLNFVLKQLQDWKEAPIDAMVLALNYLQGYYLVEISRGKQGLGNYHLHRSFAYMSEVQPIVLTEQSVFVPEDIVDRIKGKMSESNETEKSLPPMEKPIQQLTQADRARKVVEDRRISLDPVFHTFTVIGSSRPHVVTLFPKETCSCPSSTSCYHIMAARLSIGMTNVTEHRKVNLCQLRKNSRSRREKRSGRKRPRPGDIDVLPAPDAKVQLTGNWDIIKLKHIY